MTASSSSPKNDSRDQAAVRLLVENVGRLADLRQWDALAALFDTSVNLDYGKPETLTPAQIVARWKPLLSAFDSTQHVLSELRIVSLDVGNARVESRFFATHVMQGADAAGDVWTLSGRYEHTLRATDMGWKIVSMRMIPAESGGNPNLLTIALARSAKA